MYQATASVWRTPAEQMHLIEWSLLGTALFSIFFCLIFVKGFANKGVSGGLVYGFYSGLMMTFLAFELYMYLPIPFNLCLWWAITGVIQSMLAGLIAGLIYKS
jgi:hypothetical protein